MRTPEPTDRPSAVRPPAVVPPSDLRKTSSSVVPLRPSTETPAGPDDAPTIITTPRPSGPTDSSLGLTANSKLGHFEVIGSVGVGGMAAVLKARDLELGRDVALKILPPHMARDAENVTRFKQEARAAAKLDHDNIARVFFCGEDRGLHFIAFEYVDGDNLRTVIDRRGPLSPAECVRYLIQVAAGLAHAAGRGVVHRDIKPSNIIVTPDGKAKIVDMGLARNLHQSVNGGVTQSGVTLGTFDYISPEQALDPRRADVRSDIYSLGCAFYHALTGRPPVPEGTAAKKLFAHQHEPVLDPRVLNPLVPDELAAVLSRMMAKDPARRYQTPAELIAALTAVARRLNIGSDAMPVLDPGLVPADPSSVQVLPQPPRLPVGLVIGIAAVIVAGVILFGLPGSSRPLRTGLPTDMTGSPKTGSPVDPTPPQVVPVPQTRGAIQTAARVEDLAQLLADPAVTEIHLEAGKTYDLTTLPTGVLVQSKPGVTVIGQPGLEPPVVRVAAYPTSESRHTSPPSGTLTIDKAKLVRFQGIRFDVANCPVSDETTDRPVGVLISDTAKLELSESSFHADPALTFLDTAGLTVTRSTTGPPTGVDIRNCYFGLRRGVAVQLAGAGLKVTVKESAFDRHLAVFALRGDPSERSELTLQHCTFLLDRGAVADADETRWTVSAGFCVFAAVPQDPTAMMMATSPDGPVRKPVILRLAGDSAAARFTGTGEPNAYYHTDAVADTVRDFTFDEARQWPNQSPAADAAAVELTQSPWEAADPAAELDRRPEPDRREEPWKAFRLKTSIPQLRSPTEVILGVRSLPRDGDKIYYPWPPTLIDSAAGNPKVKVWWPDPPAEQQGSLPPFHYKTLKDAVAALKSDDEIQIRHNGILPVPQTVLDTAKLRVTLKPYPGHHPVLVPENSRALDTGLFKLVEGELTLDGLEIHLRGRPDHPGEIRSRAAVTIGAGRRCVLRSCVITCDEQDDEKMAAVVLMDSDVEARTDSDRRPDVRLENCLLRGRGRAVWVTASRPFDLTLSNTMTALAGPVIAVDAASHMVPTGTSARVRLTRLTAALAGPLLDLKPGPGAPGRTAGWVPVEVQPERCLFAPAERGYPLVRVEGGDPMSPERTFTWQPALAGPSWYANFPAMATFLDVTPADDMSESRTWDATGWFRQFGERADRSTGTVKFERLPESSQKLIGLQPADLTLRMVQIPGAMVGDAGAEGKQLPTPTER